MLMISGKPSYNDKYMLLTQLHSRQKFDLILLILRCSNIENSLAVTDAASIVGRDSIIFAIITIGSSLVKLNVND